MKAKKATRQIEAFEQRCRRSNVLPLTDEIIVQAANVYADLHQRGRLISDADILIAATALVRDLTLATENTAQFRRILGLSIKIWRSP